MTKKIDEENSNFLDRIWSLNYSLKGRLKGAFLFMGLCLLILIIKLVGNLF